MPDFVFEIGTEEIPARFLAPLRLQLKGLTQDLLQGYWLTGSVEAQATPRRLVVYVPRLPEVQEQREETVTGPPKAIAFSESGGPTQAAYGFARGQGVDWEQLFVQSTERGEYLALRRTMGGQSTLRLLPEVCAGVLNGLSLPKTMRWEASQARFVRPIRWLLALFGAQVVDVEAGPVKSGRQTFGHRTMGYGPWEVARAEDYSSVLFDQGKVVLDVTERTKIITDGAESQAKVQGGQVAWDDALLSEVADLVEWPQPVLGRFDPGFLDLPREVLLTSMQGHQKSFGVQDNDERLLPYFVCTLNLEPNDLELVRRGWERVLRARLEDARFFWQVDVKSSLESWLERLNEVIFLGPLGSMGDKSRRLEALSKVLAQEVAPDLAPNAARAGLLAKVDLVSEMVGEFAELQGIMGGIYAGQKGEDAAVARAISEHYLPTGAESELPGGKEGALVALADKADTLAGCFGLGMVPDGTNDPYALRRQALGIIRILLEFDWHLSLKAILNSAWGQYSGQIEWEVDPRTCLATLEDFFVQRLKSYFQAKGYSTKIVAAAIGGGWDDIPALAKRLAALHAFAQQDDYESAVLTFKRADNIIRKQGNQVDLELDGEYAPDALEEEQEKALAKALIDLGPQWDRLWRQEAFGELLGLLRELRPVVDAFFDQVLVMCQDPVLRRNRLNLLKALTDRLSLLADFSEFQV